MQPALVDQLPPIVPAPVSGSPAPANAPARPAVLSPHLPGQRWSQAVREFVWQKSQEVGLKSAPFNVNVAKDVDEAGIRQGMWIAGDMHPLENVMRQILQREEVKHGVKASEKRDRKEKKHPWEEESISETTRRRSAGPAATSTSDELRGPELENVWREMDSNPTAVLTAAHPPPLKRTRSTASDEVATELANLRELVTAVSRRQEEVLEMLKVMLPLHVQIHSAVIPEQPVPPAAPSQSSLSVSQNTDPTTGK